MPKQILLVDDSVTIQRVVQLTFAHEVDYKVIAAKSHDEGLAKARDIKPDIVLADAGMQGKTGYDLCAALRADGDLASTPILILTGNFSPYDEVRGQRAGADGYVVKPFETQALIDKVADAINRKGARPSTPAVAAAPAPAPVPPPPSRKDDSLEISIEGDVRAKPAPAPTPPPAARPAPPPPTPAPTAKPPTAPPQARTMMGMQAPAMPTPPPPAKPMMPEALSKPLSMVEPPRPAPPAPTPPPPMAPPPVVAPVAAAPVAAPAAAPSSAAKPAAAMPQAVPTMPRQPLIPNVPAPAHPQQAARADAPKPPPPRATLMGIPTVNPANLPPGTMALPPTNKPAAPWAPPVAAAPPMPAPAAAPPSSPAHAASPAMASVVSAVTDRAVGDLSARGPEYEAIAKLSREVIEQIVWEVVPELAETIIREQLDRLVAERQK